MYTNLLGKSFEVTLKILVQAKSMV